MVDNSLQYGITFKIADAKQQIDFLTKAVNKLDTSVIKISKRNIGIFEKQFAKATDPLRESVETIKILDSEISKIQKKIRATIATQGATAARNLIGREQVLQKRRAAAIVAASQNPIITQRTQQVSDAYSTPLLKSDAALKLNTTALSTLKNGRIHVSALRKETDKLSETTQKAAGSWQKLLGRIKNIGIYRAIRSAMRLFTQGISEGVSELSLFDETTNKSMANIKASFGKLTNTLAISFTSLLQSLQPTITSITDSITGLLNSFNRALAKAQGKDFYLRAKTNAEKYTEAAKKAQKFSFDVFETLSGGDESNPEDDFEKVYFSDAAKEAAGDTEGIVESAEQAQDGLNGVFENLVKIVEALGGIKSIIGVLFGLGIYAAITKLTSGFGGFIGKMTEAFSELKNFKKAADDAKTSQDNLHKSTGNVSNAVSNLGAGLVSTGLAVTAIVKNWDNMSDAAKGLSVAIAALSAVIATVAAGILIAKGQWLKALSVAGTILGTGMAVSAGIATIQGFADGGFTTANLIATNENGRREWIGRNAGATAVVNDTQMSDIMYQAVRDGCYQGILQAAYESPTSNMSGGDIILQVNKDVLGRVVAESVGFRNEVNRRNTNLNIR